MGIRVYKPTSAGRRFGSVSDFAECTFPRGHKKMYRLIDFKRNKKDGVAASVVQVEYDPNRSSRIALIQYTDGEKAYILAPDGLKAGDTVSSGPDAEARIGNCLPMSRIPLGMAVHNVEMQPGRGGQICRSAGCSATLSAREQDWAQITMPSGEVRRMSADCRATIG